MTTMPIPDRGAVDSRQYRFAFAIDAFSAVPADFVLPPDIDAFDAGVFLPRDDADWLGRRKYPPRILLLRGREVLIVPHPAAGEHPVRIPLDRIERLEWGRILLIGGIALTCDGGQIRLQYNTRSRGPVEQCIKALQDRWLPPTPTNLTLFAGAFDVPLDLKFKYARSAELLAGETPLAQFFQPPPAADLVLLTSRRLFWITERRKGRYERYGTVSRSARLTSVTGVTCVDSKLAMLFKSGDSWCIPLREEQRQQVQQFAARLEGGL